MVTLNDTEVCSVCGSAACRRAGPTCRHVPAKGQGVCQACGSASCLQQGGTICRHTGLFRAAPLAAEAPAFSEALEVTAQLELRDLGERLLVWQSQLEALEGPRAAGAPFVGPLPPPAPAKRGGK